jgi:soluble lytic murein transglycosylase-like protein
MFSESISKLISQSNANSAKERVAQIEGLLLQHIQDIKPIDTQKVNPVQFSDYMKTTPQSDLKFRLAPPPSVSKVEIQNIVKQVADKHQIDEKLILAIINQESGFNSNAVSSAGAQGLMQLMPATAKRLGVVNPFDPVQNIEGGVKHMKGLMAKYRGNLVLALAAYNAGGGNVDKYGGIPPFKETQNYVKSILSKYLS